MMLLAAALVFAGTTGLCVAMDRHQAQILMVRLETRTVLMLRGAAVVLLACAYVAASAAKGWSMGAVAWFSLCAAMIAVLVLLLTYAPRLLPRLTLAALAIGGLASLVGL